MNITKELRHASLAKLVERLRWENERKHDIVVDADHVAMNDDAGVTIERVPVEHDQLTQELATISGVSPSKKPNSATLRYQVLHAAHSQFANRLRIPVRYYHRMRDNTPALLSQNVNTWLRQKDRRFLVRTFRPQGADGGTIRALLSNSFKFMENVDLLFTALDVIKEMGLHVNVKSCNLTNRHMYVALSAPRVQTEAPELLRRYKNPRTGRRDVRLTAGFVLSNSETGHGAFQIAPRPTANCCTNALTWKQDRLRKIHLGSQLERGSIRWSKRTKEDVANALKSQVRDAAASFLSERYLREVTAKMLEAGSRRLKHPVEAVQNATKHLGLTEEEQDDVLSYFVEGGDTRSVGVAQALTFHAQDVSSADKQFQIEEKISDVLGRMSQFDQNN